jgi:hypothetical protein
VCKFVSHIFSLVTLASVVVSEGACLLAVPEYSATEHSPVSLRITQPIIFMPKPECFSGTYFLKITLPLQSTVISNAKCSVWL